LKLHPALTPKALKTMAAGQNPVIDACIMLTPAKAVRSQIPSSARFHEE
jgi:hypothetical protein